MVLFLTKGNRNEGRLVCFIVMPIRPSSAIISLDSLGIAKNPFSISSAIELVLDGKFEDAETLAAEKELAELFEQVAAEIDPLLAAKWLRRDLMKVLHYNKKELKEVQIDAKHIIELLTLIKENKINDATAKELLIKLVEKPFSPIKHVKKEKLEMVSSSEELESICKEVIKNNKSVVDDYKSGKQEALHYLIGQVMKLSKGKANPKEVEKIFRKLFQSS